MDNYAFLRGQAFSCVHSGLHPSSGGKEGTMHIRYRLENGFAPLVPVTPETVEYILRNDREMANADRKEEDRECKGR